MTYKPVICELKCISRDIQRAQREIATAEDNTSFKEYIKETLEDFKRMTMSEFLQLGCVFAIVIVFAIAVAWAVKSIIISLIAIILGILFILYSFGRYIANVHQRCVDRYSKKLV